MSDEKAAPAPSGSPAPSNGKPSPTGNAQKTVWSSDEITTSIKKYKIFINDANQLKALVGATQTVSSGIADNAGKIQAEAQAVLDALKSVKEGKVADDAVADFQDHAAAILRELDSIQTAVSVMQTGPPALSDGTTKVQAGSKKFADFDYKAGDVKDLKAIVTTIKADAKSVEDMANILSGRPKTATDFLFKAVDANDQGKVDEAGKYMIQTSEALSDAVNRLKRCDQYRYVLTIYGAWPIIAGIAWLVLFGALFLFWPLAWLHPTQNLGLPEWAGAVGGIGACVQIFVSVVSDIQNQGYSDEYRRMWYWVVPLVGVIFGFLAYLLFAVGQLSLGQSPSTTTSASPLFFPIIWCFLAGYSTDWLKSKLDQLANPPSKGAGTTTAPTTTITTTATQQ